MLSRTSALSQAARTAGAKLLPTVAAEDCLQLCLLESSGASKIQRKSPPPPPLLFQQQQQQLKPSSEAPWRRCSRLGDLFLRLSGREFSPAAALPRARHLPPLRLLLRQVPPEKSSTQQRRTFQQKTWRLDLLRSCQLLFSPESSPAGLQTKRMTLHRRATTLALFLQFSMFSLKVLSAHQCRQH